MLFLRKNVTNPQYSATQATEINTFDQITGKGIDVSRTHIPLKALVIPLKRVNLRGAVYMNQCSNKIIVPRHSPQKCGLGSFFNIIRS